MNNNENNINTNPIVNDNTINNQSVNQFENSIENNQSINNIEANREVNSNYNQNLSLDEKLLSAYVGNNYDKIINKKFNVSAFFFSFFYLAYRKIYLLTFILLVVLNLLSKISNILSFITIIVLIVIGFTFNKNYILYSKKQIDKIKKNNSNLSEEQLIEIVRKKGGTSTAGMIIFMIIWFVIAAFLNSVTPTKYKTATVGDYDNDYVLEYSVPSNLMNFSSDDDYKLYGSISGLKASCKYEIIYNNTPFDVYGYENEEALRSAFDSEYSTINLNDKTWHYKNKTGKIEYAFYDEDVKALYKIFLEGDSQCLSYNDKISQSFKFVNSGK